jgi:hypothetical protein
VFKHHKLFAHGFCLPLALAKSLMPHSKVFLAQAKAIFYEYLKWAAQAPSPETMQGPTGF